MAPLTRNAQPKPKKGTVWLEGRERRAERKNHERREMEAAKRRDGHTCRWPGCTYMPNKPRIECAHVVEHRKMGGNPDGTRTQQRDLMALCFIHHQAHDDGDIRIEAQTEAGMDGPCDFYELMFNSGRWRLWARESVIGVSTVRSYR